MVLMSGSKMARYQTTLVNRGNCGGNKKTGLGRVTGILSLNHIIARTLDTTPVRCDYSLGPRQVTRMGVLR